MQLWVKLSLPLGMVELGWSSVFHRAGGTHYGPHYLPVKKGTARLSFKDEPLIYRRDQMVFPGDVSWKERASSPASVRALGFLVIIQ